MTGQQVRKKADLRLKVIAAVDIMEGNVVRLVQGDPCNKIVYSDNAVETAAKWESLGADMLHVVDLDATLQTGKKNDNASAISNIIDAVKIPVQVAGGIRSPESASEWLEKKAARVIIGTMAYREPDRTKKLLKKYGEKIIISIDQTGDQVMIEGWQKASGYSLQDALANFLAMGASEFLLTTIDRDGTLQGPDVQTLTRCASSGARIIASGGISNLHDTIRVRVAGCSSVILGKALYDGRVSIQRVKEIA